MGGEVLVGSACRELRRADLVVQRVLLDVDTVRAGLPGPLGVLLDRVLQVFRHRSTSSRACPP